MGLPTPDPSILKMTIYRISKIEAARDNKRASPGEMFEEQVLSVPSNNQQTLEMEGEVTFSLIFDPPDLVIFQFISFITWVMIYDAHNHASLGIF